MFALRTLRQLHSSGCNSIRLNQRFIATNFQTFNQTLICAAPQHLLVRQNSTSSPASSQTPPTNQIYFGTLTPKIRAVKIFSLTTSIAGLSAQPVLIERASELGGTSIVILVCSFVGFFTFITPLVLHFITKKYVTEITYDPVKDEYTATTLSIFLRKKETKFKVQDVHVPEVAGMFTTFLAKNRPLFVDAELFSDPSHYVKMMGYDKPIDFHLGKVESVDTKIGDDRNK
ncbi:Transmembrane protein 70 like, mitochondrial [Pseudolycoriella hygida]|uniref:Transmembrane protein 70 like, mitochondrial n=1 Tax=Pseudolycoriella hygida TaxID=35572 RepID=A0A9Q0N0T4_9DIPT|nr:Transmembrane protein 70 like, mitochondrial [Pseudolycoriella hygida]